MVFLGDGNELSFPAIGSIKLEEVKNVSYSDFKLDFNPHSSFNYISQLQYFSSLWNKSEIEVNRFFLGLSDKVLGHCQKHQNFVLPDLGTFSLQDKQLYFLSSYKLEDTFRQYFAKSVKNKQLVTGSTIISQPLATNSINSKEEIKQEDPEESKEIVEEETNSNEETYYISRPRYYKQIAAFLLIVITAFSGLYVYNTFFNSYTFPAKFDLSESEYLESDYNRSPNEKEFKIQEVNPYQGDIIESDSEQLDEKRADASAETTVLDNHVEFKITQSIKQDLCTFILGSFTNTKNVDALKSKIIELDEQAIVLYSNKLSRVGVQIPCGDQTKLSRLLSISPEMWLLDE